MRRAGPVVAVVLAVAFLVVPSVARLVFLWGDAAAGDATDAAFRAHPATGVWHIVPGLGMVALAPLQLHPRVRARWPALHRWGGRLFVLAALSVCVTAVRMNVVFPVVGGALKLSVINTMAAALAVTLALGLRAMLRREVAAHRRWMLRATGVMLSGGGAGVFALPMFAAGWPADRVTGVGRWLGFVATMAAVELWLRADGAAQTGAAAAASPPDGPPDGPPGAPAP